MERCRRAAHTHRRGARCDGGVVSRHHRAKLEPHDVRLMRALHEEGLGYRRIARKFAVHWVTVRDALTFRTWRWVR